MSGGLKMAVIRIAIRAPSFRNMTASSSPTVKQTKLYTFLINTLDPLVPEKMRPLWMHPAGPKTVFFWGPIIKWGLVVAGIKDLTRTADTISVYQSASIAVSALIYSRWSLVIIPKNYLLFACNSFVSLFQTIQLLRALNYKRQHPRAENEKK